jgi:hypothetical protein
MRNKLARSVANQMMPDAGIYAQKINFPAV